MICGFEKASAKGFQQHLESSSASINSSSEIPELATLDGVRLSADNPNPTGRLPLSASDLTG